MTVIDILTPVSFIALNTDILLQNYRVYHLHNAVDISLPGVFLRLFAVSILTVKFWALNEFVLFIGQGLLTLNVTLYAFLVLRYHKKKRRSK